MLRSMKWLRGPVTGLCATLCVVGLLFGVTATYFSRTLFDPTMFSNRVAACFADPHVSHVVAGVATDQILAMNRDLTPYRPIILGAVERAVASAPFGAIVRRAAMKIHPILITHGEDLSLTIKDINSIVRTQLAMSPQLLAKLPAKSQLALGSAEGWPNGHLLMRVIRVGHRLQRQAIGWLAIGVVTGVLGLRLSRRKFRYLLSLGLWLSGTALLLAGISRFGGAAIAPMIKSEVGAELAHGLWNVFIGPLAVRMLVLAGAGFVLIAAATSLLERIDIGEFVRLAWGRIWLRPDRAAVALLRGGLLLLTGMLVIFYPKVMVQVGTVAFGSALFIHGVQEILKTAIQLAGEDEAHHGAAGRRRGAFLPVAVAGLLVLLLAGGALWLSSRDEGAEITPTAIVACNGYAQLCDRRLNEVVFPTTHNSMSGADISNWLFPNQERSIPAQLEDGIRGFLIDVHYGERVGDRVRTLIEDEAAARKKYEAVLGKEGIDAALRIRDRLVGKAEGAPDVYLAHGFAELGYTRFVDALTEMKDFLVANPNEVVIIVIQDEGVKPVDVQKCFAESGLEDLVFRGPVTPPWPTLREMVERDARVVVFAENNSAGVPWYHQAFETIQETPYGFHKPEEFSNKPNRGGTSGSLLLMNHWIETAPSSLPSNAAIVNAYDFLLKRARACRRMRGMTPNLIAVDFYRTGDLFRVARTMNGIPEPLGPPKP
jgi:multisubunit Na+/H+ antiporter MnhC subunit